LNSKRLLSAVPNDKLSKPDLNLDLDELPIECELGIYVGLLKRIPRDTFGFEIRNLVRPETKHGILSTVCSFFDPLQFAEPVVLTARRLFQDLWKVNVGWDEPLNEEFLSGEHGTLSNDDPLPLKLQLHVFR